MLHPRWLLMFLGFAALLALMPLAGAAASATATPVHATTTLVEGRPALRAGAGVAPPAPRHADTIVAGTLALVSADGDCLRLRSAPGLAGERLVCLPEGSSVLVLDETADVDGLRWRRVQATGVSGWVAERYLVTAPESVSCGTTNSTRPGVNGDLPADGGVGLVVWGGGTAQGVVDAAVAAGCSPRSIWTSVPGVGLVGYLPGAPDFVNRAWTERFPGAVVPAGSPLLLVCDAPTAGQASAARSPLATAPAPSPATAVPPPEVIAAAAVVIDGASGALLYDQNAHQPLAPASLTKIATAILTIEQSDLDSWVLNAVDSLAMPGSSIMGLRPGDCFTVRDLLYGLMLPSGNDAALALGQHIAGGDAAFVSMMGALVQNLGLTDTHFIDPHGLGGDAHVSSAYDVAMLSRYAMGLPEFADVVAAPQHTAFGSRDLIARNVNRFLSQYDGADGVKTGFTDEAGRTLAASATRDGRRLFAVLLNAPDRFEDAERLLDWAFENFAWPQSAGTAP